MVKNILIVFVLILLLVVALFLIPFTLSLSIIVYVIIILPIGIFLLLKPKSQKVIFDFFLKKGLVILGMQQSGKTTIYDYLQGKKNAGASTNIDEYEEFKYYINDKHSVKIRKGRDIGGGEEFIKSFYTKMIQDSDIDICLFVFNAYKYVHEEEYRRDVNARLGLLHRKGILEKKTAIIGSFEDLFPKAERGSVYETIRSLSAGKPYAELLTRQHFYVTDLTKKDQLKDLIDLTFKK